MKDINYSLYDRKFFEGLRDDSALNDHKFFAKIIYDIVKPKSVIDIGCGAGGWLSVFKNEYNCRITGVDGDYLDREKLLINDDEFITYDLEKHFKFNPKNIEDKFDLAMSLEVAEHLPPSRGPGFIDDLTELSDAVFFSAAVPNQGG